jgi:hypothetical protein
MRAILGGVLFFCLGGDWLGQAAGSDPRKTDELILLDISGSMVRDIRTALLARGWAKSPRGPDDFDFKITASLPEALRHSALRSIVTNIGLCS